MDAIVNHRGITRKARGFSCKEIEDAKLTREQFCVMGLPWDSRRRTSYKENVDLLKKAEKPAAPSKAKKQEKK